VAITENRGGNRPTAPQNNPNNIGAGGGNTQSGKASGFAYGMNKAINEQQSQGNAAVASIASPAPSGSMPGLAPVTSITAPTELPNQPVTDGAPIGAGMNSIPGLPQPQIADNTQFNQNIEAYRPVLTYIANQPSTSTDTRKVISLLLTTLPNENMA